MSAQTQRDIDTLIKRGTPESDPRIQGLKRRLEREAQLENEAARATQGIVAGVREALKQET